MTEERRLKRCPKCGKFDVEYSPTLGWERCLWRDCMWINYGHVDLDKVNYKLNFAKFYKSLKPKLRIIM